MADNQINYTQGTAGGTIATDEVTYAGVAVHMQRIKVHDGTEGGTAGWAISSSGVGQTFQTNTGTVILGGVSTGDALEVWPNTAGTVSVSNAVAVWPNSAGTVVLSNVTGGGTLLGAAGTVAVQKMLTPAGDSMIDDTNDAVRVNVVAGGAGGGEVTQGTDPWIIAGTVTSSVSVGDVAITGGTLDLVKAGTVAAWVNTAGTVSVSNTVPVWTNNGGTVVVSNVTGGGTLLGAAGTVNVANTVATWNSNGGTVTLGGVSTGDALEVWPNSAGTVSVSSGVVAAWVNTAGTVASVATYEGKTRGGTIINLSASGTVVSAVASNYLKVYSEHFTSTGTIVVTVRNGLNGSTIVGPRTFVPGGGVARQAPVTSPLFITAAGSPIHYELSGSGTIGGDIAWIQETSA